VQKCFGEYMMRRVYLVISLLAVGVGFTFCQTPNEQPFAKYGVYNADVIKAEEYRQRRLAVMAKMDSESVAIFRANDSDNRNSDTDYKYRQNDNMLYLTGCEEANSTLVIIPDGFQLDSVTIVKEIFFVRARSRSWSGDNLGIEGAKELLGFGNNGTASIALTTDKLKEILPQILQKKKILYYSPVLPDVISEPVTERKFVPLRELKKGLEEKYPGVSLKPAGQLVNDLRVIKSSDELTFMQKAIDATVTGFIEAAKSCEPEMFEYQLQAVIDYCFTKAGCEYYGFPSIVGSGPNTLIFHYEANRRKMKTADLVVMDIGAEYHGYSADVTRTIPVNGKFSLEQKTIYDIVLSAQDSAINEVRPGVMMNSSSKKAMDVIGNGLLKLGIIKDKEDARKYCPHGISHFVGLAVHDVGSMGKLAPGMVITMEPGIYIPDSSDCDKKYWGIGIRIEDDVLVTEDGNKVLSNAAPKKADEIEKLMKEKGIGNIEVGKTQEAKYRGK
jgi:Xaa-Pro aminopeptidase